MRILIVEDDETVAAGLVEGLTAAGFTVDHAPTAETAEAALSHTAYDLAIVDIGLPKMDGLELIRRLRRRSVTVPVLVLTARDAMEDRVAGLDLGADDYMTKPFLLPELLARTRALIRRSRSVASSELALGPLVLDLAGRTARLGAAPLELTGREWDILEQLMLAAPKVVSKQKLVESLSRWDNELTPNAVEIYISRLRAKLEAVEQPAPVSIRTVRGIGYRIDDLASR
jgi:DNA-binding response OmpR family regulator